MFTAKITEFMFNQNHDRAMLRACNAVTELDGTVGRFRMGCRNFLHNILDLRHDGFHTKHKLEECMLVPTDSRVSYRTQLSRSV
jgi:hypothetical protein